MPKPRKGDKGPLTLQADAGHAVFMQLARQFFRQASQPFWIRFAEAVTGDRVLHSSQINGFSTGDLKYPAPKVFVALGMVNQAIAAGAVPAGVRMPAQVLRPITLPDGTVPDACGLFAVFSGVVPVELPAARVIPEAQAAGLSALLGRYLRSQFGAQGIDFAVTDRQRLVQAAPVLQLLLAGEPAGGDAISSNLEAIAGLLGCSADELWDVVAGLLAQA